MRLCLRFLLYSLLAISVFGGASARGQGCPPMYSEYFDGVTPPVLPSGWTASQGVNITGAPLWVTSPITPDTPPNDVFSTAPDNILDNRLDTPVIFVRVYEQTVTFRQSYKLENGFDGAVLEVSAPNINGGEFTDITDPAVGGTLIPGYNTVISSAFQSPIAGRMAWSGDSGGYIYTWAHIGTIIPEYTPVALRFRLVTDNRVASVGWRIDNFDWHHNECATPTATATATATATPTATATATAAATPAATATPTATPTPTPTVTPSLMPAQALNISTRLRVETGGRVMIGGFIITGSVPKRVAIRGIGPSLANFGLGDVLADPTLDLRGSGGALLAQNDNWQDDPFGGGGVQLSALGLALQNPNESGLVATLPPGAYTVILAGKNQTSGLALVEIYDVDAGADSKLANLSTRGLVQSGANVTIGGFILGNGDGSVTVAVRGIGPSLGQLGLNDVLADPTLELRDGNGTLLVANDNWEDDPVAAALLTAEGLAPPDPLESGIFATVTPGLFTAILAGKNGGVGLGLLEIYGNVHPPTITVTSRLATGPGTLPQALLDVPNGGVIEFDTSLYGMTLGPNALALRIDKNIVLRGPGPDQLTLDLAGTRLSVIEIMSGHTVIVEGLTIRGGHSRLRGGGILNQGSTLTVNHCVVRSNSADVSGGGICNNFDGRLTLIHSTVSSNGATGDFAPARGGGIDNDGIMEIRNSTVSNNGASPSTISPGTGAGINNRGPLIITNSTVRENSVAGGGGGIVNSGPLTITNSTISGNKALPSGILGYTSSAGGISHSGDSLLTISNSTISGNSAPGRGGGILTGGPLAITNSTINDNDAGDGSGDIDNSGSLQIANTILKAGSSGATIFRSSGTVTSLGFNLSSDNGGGFLTAAGDQINTNPLLGPLLNNGGPTFTHELLTGSPAINAGTPDSSPPPAYDQRGPGYPRVINGQIDIGSFEVQPASIPTPTP